MKVPGYIRGDMQTHFTFLADHMMVDRPDGPYAQEARQLGNLDELTEEQCREVVGRCAGTLALSRGLLTEYRKQQDQHTVLLALALGAEPSAGRDGAIEVADSYLYAEPAHPQLRAALSAERILATLLPPSDNQ
jgi:hypothetical protein